MIRTYQVPLIDRKVQDMYQMYLKIRGLIKEGDLGAVERLA
jgi:hypothetical protein